MLNNKSINTIIVKIKCAVTVNTSNSEMATQWEE